VSAPARLLQALRDGEAPSPAALRAFALGLADGSVSDAQAAAFAMAVCLRGLSEEGRVALTLAMRDGGETMRWEGGPVLDKHSTGGVGDCVSLVLAPALAACGALVPMVSGRGLGHTGGTLDKLEAIPGFRVDLDRAAFERQVREVGCAIVAAGPGLAPADRRLYAVRDVTGTVRSVDLIVASILSKKLAAGLGGLVLDVKAGSGALMKSDAEAEALARALVSTAVGAGCPTVALVTDMDEPLAPALGNALEVREALATLRGAPGPLLEATAALGGEALALGRLAPDAEAGAERVRRAVSNGRAAEVFGRMVAAQGGPADLLERDGLPEAPVRRAVGAPEAGVVAAIDGEALGHAVVALGAGRRVAQDVVDPAVGLSALRGLGARVERGEPLAEVHAATEEAAEAAVRAVRGAFVLGKQGAARPLVRGRIG
jgi:thymidine phosphorylase